MNPRIGPDTQRDFELECIREFSHSGLHLGAGVSREDRRERIRAAIFREGKQNDRWRNTELSYAAAYRQAYHQPLVAREGELVKTPPKPLWGSAADADELDDGAELSEDSQDESPYLTA